MGGGRLRWFLVALALSGCAGNDKRCRRLHNMDIGCVEHWPKHRAQWSGRQWRIWGRYFPTPAPSLYAGASHPTPVPTPAPTRVPTLSPTPPSPAPTPQPTAFPTPPSPAPTPLEVRPEVLQHRCKTRYTPQCVYQMQDTIHAAMRVLLVQGPQHVERQAVGVLLPVAA